MCNRQRWILFILWSQLMYQKAYWKRHLVWSSTMSSSSQVYNVYTIQYVPFFLDFNYKKVRKSSKLINLILIWIWMYNFNFCLNLKYLIVELKLMIKHGSFTKINKHKHKHKHFVFQAESKLFMNCCFIYNPNYTLTTNL